MPKMNLIITHTSPLVAYRIAEPGFNMMASVRCSTATSRLPGMHNKSIFNKYNQEKKSNTIKQKLL